MAAFTTIDDPSAHFQIKTYTGTGATQSITNDGNSNLKPDFVWIKTRSVAHWHNLFDSSRGATKLVFSNSTTNEATRSTSLTSFNTDGFTVGADTVGTDVNGLNRPHVAWQWKANGGTTSSNTAGNITSTVQVNSTAGFSIVTWTGNENSSATVGHGLGVKPDMVFFKRRNAAYNWVVYCGQLGIVGGNNMFSYLNLQNAAEQGAGFNFTSTTITPTNGAPTNSGDMIAYCFAGKQGYSKFGKYAGNGSADGPFVYTGFKPAFVILKNASASRNWYMWDNKRSPFNAIKDGLNPNTANTTQGAAYEMLDFLSNGFKIRSYADGTWNGSGNTHIYMAFAENPFVTSTGVPACAR